MRALERPHARYIWHGIRLKFQFWKTSSGPSHPTRFRLSGSPGAYQVIRVDETIALTRDVHTASSDAGDACITVFFAEPYTKTRLPA